MVKRKKKSSQIHTDVNEVHQYWLQVTECGSGLHAETQLLLKVTTEGNLDARTNSWKERQKQ